MLKEKILAAAAEHTKKPASSMDLIGGFIVLISPNSEKIISLEELATETFYSVEHAQHLTAETTVQVKSNAFSLGCGFAEVEVDIPLAKVKLINMVNCHDCGKLINPLCAAGQVHGGMSMAIGFGLYEQLIHDPKTGRLLNGNLLDYKLPTIMDHPHLEAQFVENWEPTNPYGTKALGEPPTVPGAAAIRNAVLHATGVGINKIPLTPHLLFAEFKAIGLLQEGPCTT